MNAEIINEKMKDDFSKNITYENLEKYAMSELLSPIEDYYNFMEIIKNNLDILENLELVYVATDLERLWSNESFFLNYLNKQLTSVSDSDKSIILYLNALQIKKTDRNFEKNKEFKSYLRKSVELSKNFNFVNNRKELANLLTGSDKQKVLKEIHQNIEREYNYDDIKKIDVDEWLSAKFYIDEFITGVSQNVLEKAND